MKNISGSAAGWIGNPEIINIAPKVKYELNLKQERGQLDEVLLKLNEKYNQTKNKELGDCIVNLKVAINSLKWNNL